MDRPLKDLRSAALSSGFIVGVTQAIQFGLNLLSVVLLARLLTPQDFGLVAMVTAIMGFLRIFSDGGLSTATVQSTSITHAQVSNLFWANVALGGVITLALALLAPFVASFYGEPRLVAITLALCITFIVIASTVQPMALLKRQMRFKAIGSIQVSSIVAGIVAGVWLAWRGWGHWSLVGLQLATVTTTLLCTWYACEWRPQWPRRNSGTRGLLGFGANLTASSFIWSVVRGSDALLIGRFWGTVPLGLYSRAQALLIRPMEQFVTPLEAVIVPVLSRLQTQPDRYRRVALQAYDSVALVSFPAAGILLALAHPLTLVVLGPQWEEAANVFAAFTLMALYTPVASVSSCLLMSQGRGRDFLRVSTVASLTTAATFVAGIQFGPVGVATAYSLGCLAVHLPWHYFVAGRQGPVSTADLWSRFFTFLPIWAAVGVATYLLRRLLEEFSAATQVMVCAPAGLVVSLGVVVAYPPARQAASNLYETWRKSGLLPRWSFSA
jgi:PST family polysaccharide transporter